MSRKVIVSDRRGREVEMRSMAHTAREMGIGLATLRRRVADGNWIHREGYVAVRVRTA